MKHLRSILSAALFMILMPGLAFAQTSPNWPGGFVPTPAQWNGVLAAKQDYSPATLKYPSGGVSGHYPCLATYPNLVDCGAPVTLTAGAGVTITGGPAYTINISPSAAFGNISATSLALGGAAIGSNALAVTGSSSFGGNLTVGAGYSLRTNAIADTAGNTLANWTAGAGNPFNLTAPLSLAGTAQVSSPSAGLVQMTDGASGFAGLLLGPPGTAYVRLSPSGAGAMSLRLADNSNLAGLTVGRMFATNYTGAWAGNVIGSAYGGAGSISGLLKANGSGVVTQAVAGTDYAAATALQPSGTPATGNLAKFASSSTITNGDLSGDCTTSGALAIICTKTNGQAFVASATTDTTNAGNIQSGVLAAARGGAGAVNGALKGNGAGVVTQAAAADLSNGVTGSGLVVLATAPTLVTPVLGTPASGVMTNLTGTQKGDTTGGNAAAGQVGEYLSVFSTSTAATSGSNINITSLVLTAGDWDVSANCGLNTGASSVSSVLACSISTTSAAISYGTDFGMAENIGTVNSGSYYGFSPGTKRIVVSVSTTVYLVATSTYTGSTLTFNGGLRARRMR